MTSVGYSWVMLNSATISISGFTGVYSLWAKLNSQNISKNQSNITIEWDYRCTYRYASSNDAQDYVTGAGWNTATYRTYDATSDTTLISWTGNVSHASDGTYSQSVWGRTRLGGLGADTDWIEGNVTLPNIPRGSHPTASPSEVRLSPSDGVTQLIMHPAVSTFTHEIWVYTKDDNGNYYQIDHQTGIGNMAVVNVPVSLLSRYPSRAVIQGYVWTRTFNGSTRVGDTSYEPVFTIIPNPDTEHAVISAATITDTNTKSAAIEASGSLIKWASNLHAVIDFSVAGNYTSLSDAWVLCGTYKKHFLLNGTTGQAVVDIDKIDADTINITLYDARGNEVQRSETWTLIPYVDLSCTASVIRTSATGNTVQFKLTGRCFAGSFGSTTNQITVSYKYKLRSASTWTDGTQTFTFTPSGEGETTYNYSNTISGFAYDQQYDIQFFVEDVFTEAESSVLALQKGIPVYGNGEDWFAVYGDLFVHPDRDNIDNFFSVADLMPKMLFDTYQANPSSDWNTERYNEYEIHGNGFIIFMVNPYTSGNQSYGNITASIQHLMSDNTWGYDAYVQYRHDQGMANSYDGTSITAPMSVTDGERIRCTWYISKEVQKSCRVKMLGFGVTATQTVNGGAI